MQIEPQPAPVRPAATAAPSERAPAAPLHAGPGRPRVVIVGAGFGGLAAARSLAGVGVDVTICDRLNYHLFQPLLYQVALAGLSPNEIAVPIRSILWRQPNVDVVLAEVAGIDLGARRLELSDQTQLHYDYLIVAAGAETNYHGHDGWVPFAPDRAVRLEIVDLIEMRDGKIAHIWRTSNPAALLER